MDNVVNVEAKTKEIKLKVKQAIFKSWAMELLKKGIFDEKRYTNIVKKIDALKQ